MGSNLSVESADNANEPTKYYAGEVRKETTSSLTSVAIAVEGVSLENEKEALACAILQRASGNGPRVKWGCSPSSLQKQLSSIAGSEPFGLSTFNASYTDSGLFGVVLCSTSNVVGSVSGTEFYNYNKYYFNINFHVTIVDKRSCQMAEIFKNI